jgi:hypothetical protein
MKLAALPIFAACVTASTWAIEIWRSRGCLARRALHPARAGAADADGTGRQRRRHRGFDDAMRDGAAEQMMRLILHDMRPTTVTTGNITSPSLSQQWSGDMSAAASPRRVRLIVISPAEFIAGVVAGGVAETDAEPGRWWTGGGAAGARAGGARHAACRRIQAAG